MGETGNTDQIVTLKPLEKCLLKDGDGRETLRQILGKQAAWMGSERKWLRMKFIGKFLYHQWWIFGFCHPVFVRFRNCSVQHKQTTMRYKILNHYRYH
jgi:hypothetical protein